VSWQPKKKTTRAYAVSWYKQLTLLDSSWGRHAYLNSHVVIATCMYRPMALASVQLQSASTLQVTNQIREVIAASLGTSRGDLFLDDDAAPKKLCVFLDGSGITFKVQLTSKIGPDYKKVQATTGWNAAFCALTGLNQSKHI